MAIRFTSRARAALGAALTCGALMVAVGLQVTPAGAGPSAETGARGGGRDSATVTEDHDGNDGGTPNNVVDDGDNRHPSGRDRSVERGPGHQGRSTSDPDDDGRGPDRSNGGADKPDGPGGEDLADQDGNNGCGNDDDFEDDNEGWCGGKPRGEAPGDQGATTPDATTAPDGDEIADEGDGAPAADVPSPTAGTPPGADAVGSAAATTPLVSEVLGVSLQRAGDGAPSAGVTAGPGETEVLAAQATGTGTLPRTGTGVLLPIAVAVTLLAVGMVLRRNAGRSRRGL